MLQRLPVALSEVRAGNSSKNVLNKICQMIYSLYWKKKQTKRVYNKIMNSSHNELNGYYMDI